jgi:hypothetical protein
LKYLFVIAILLFFATGGFEPIWSRLKVYIFGYATVNGSQDLNLHFYAVLQTIQETSQISFATFSDSMNIFLVTSLSGRVDTRDTNGNHIRTICNEAIEARFMDDKILVRTRNSNQLRDKQGNLIRNI